MLRKKANRYYTIKNYSYENKKTRLLNYHPCAPLFLAACADKDVYNPDKVRPVAPVENPLGEDFVAPDGFDWSMITTVKLNVEVKVNSTDSTII